MSTVLLLICGLALGQDGRDPVPPPEVEAGSTREAYEVREGDTFASIAAEYGFLPDELRAWNDMPAGEPEPGSVIWMWVAPVAPTAASPVAEAAPSGGVGFFVGAQVGPAIGLTELGTAFTPRIELGLELPPLDRALRLWVAVQYLRPSADGQADDPRVGGAFTYELDQDELSVAFGPALRLSMLDLPVVPEIAAGPSVYTYRSTVDGSAGGAPFPESTERYTRLGVYAQAGAALPVGPGEATLHLALHSSGLDGVITGDASSAALSPLLGYRFVF